MSTAATGKPSEAPDPLGANDSLLRLIALASTSAALIGLAGRPWVTGYLAWVALVPLLAALYSERRPWRGALAGWIAALGTGLVAFEGVAPAEFWAYPALAAFSAVSLAIASAIVVLAARRLGSSRALWLFPLLLVAAEFVPAQRWVFGNFANGMTALGYTQFDTLLIEVAGWSGVSGVSLLLAAINLAVFQAWCRRFLPAAVIAVAALALAVLPVPGSRTEAGGEALRVALIQGSVSSVDSLLARFDREAAKRMLGSYEDLTTQAAERDVDLVVWGETVIPQAVRPGHVPDYVQRALEPAPVALVGGVSFTGENSYNSVFHWQGGQLTEVYRKRALVPFNERHYTAGIATPPLDVAGTAVGLGVCLDSVFGSLARESVRAGAQVLAYLTEDSFAGRTVTPELHLRVTAFRAAETGRQVVFANQSGPSAVIGPDGRVIARIDHRDTAGVTASLSAYQGLTPFVRLGDWVGSVATLLAFAVLALAVAPSRTVQRWRTGVRQPT